jgi:WD repeat-containing protein 35
VTTRDSTNKSINVVKFYDSVGTYLRNIRIPGEEIAGLSWEGTGLRICLAVDAFIYFANIRPAYKWASIDNTIVYSYYKPERHETAVVFWDSLTNEFQTKYVPSLLFLASYDNICVLVVGETSKYQVNS